MPSVPAGTARLQLNWSLEGGQEIAVNTIHGHLVGGPFEAGWPDLPALVDAQAAKVLSLWGSLQGFVHTSVKLKSLGLYILNPATGIADDGGHHTFAAGECVGTAGGTLLPPTISAVATLWAYPPGGFSVKPRRHRGRLFWPGLTTGSLNASTGELDTAWGDSLAGSLSGLLSGLNDVSVPSATWESSVLSKASSALYGIESVTVSGLYGVQRRRQNSLVRTRTASHAVS